MNYNEFDTIKWKSTSNIKYDTIEVIFIITAQWTCNHSCTNEWLFIQQWKWMLQNQKIESAVYGLPVDISSLHVQKILFSLLKSQHSQMNNTTSN